MPTLQLPVQLPVTYTLRGGSASHPEKLVLLLHGYNESGERILRKLEKAIPDTWAILAPDAPFPVADRKEGRYRVGYSWYFYDFFRDEYVVDMATAIQCVSGLVRELGFERFPARIIGFSQGAYLAPLVARELASVEQVIGIAGSYLPEEIGELSHNLRLDSVHGAQDEVVEAEGARSSHQIMMQKGHPGEFSLIEGSGHRITPEIEAEVARLLLAP